MGQSVWNAEHADSASDIVVVAVLMCLCSSMSHLWSGHRGDTRVEVLALALSAPFIPLFLSIEGIKQTLKLHVLHSNSGALVKL